LGWGRSETVWKGRIWNCYGRQDPKSLRDADSEILYLVKAELETVGRSRI
jgi:hypothetical protein